MFEAERGGDSGQTILLARDENSVDDILKQERRWRFCCLE